MMNSIPVILFLYTFRLLSKKIDGIARGLLNNIVLY